METVTLNGITYEVHDTPPEGFAPDRTVGTPLGKYTLYRNHQPRYIFLSGKLIPNPAFRRALIRGAKRT